MLRVLLMVLLISTVTGCGPAKIPSGTVSGKVEFKTTPKSPVDLIILGLQSGHASSSSVGDDGAFKVDTPLPVGEYAAYFAPQAPPADIQKEVKAVIDKSIPGKYWSESSSPLRIQIQEGENTATLTVE